MGITLSTKSAPLSVLRLPSPGFKPHSHRLKPSLHFVPISLFLLLYTAKPPASHSAF